LSCETWRQRDPRHALRNTCHRSMTSEPSAVQHRGGGRSPCPH
jgi:hypothetical protein